MKKREILGTVLLAAMLAAGSVTVLAEEDNTEQETQEQEGDIQEQQSEIDAALQAELENGYALEDALIVVNPYGTAPLSAVAVFTTEEACGGTVTVKGKLPENDVTGTFEADTDHIVPIYGLYSGQATEVVITLDDGTSTTFSVETESVNVDYGTIQTEMLDESAYDYSQLTFVCSTNGICLCSGCCRGSAFFHRYGRYAGSSSAA